VRSKVIPKAEKTGLAVKTVKNTLMGLRKQCTVERTGDKKGRTEQVRLIVPASLPNKRDGDDALDDLISGLFEANRGESGR
jgi:hypothetical protein